MTLSPPVDGLRNEALRAALNAALAGQFARLDDLLSRLGRGDGPRPNLRLAAAFGAEVGAQPPELGAQRGSIVRLLSHLGDVDAAPDQPAVFLPVAAAHGWAALLQSGREQERAWTALATLAADERTHVRLGALDALTAVATRRGGREGRPGDIVVSRALGWLDLEDREVRFGAAAVVVEIFADAGTLAALADPEALLTYLTRAIDNIADAPRAAERSDARRRLLMALPRTLAAVVSHLTTDEMGTTWLEAECVRARHPDVRQALSNTLIRFASRGADPGTAVTDRLRIALQQSAKPDRDPTRRRPGSARGKASRPVR
ncbi:MAG: hypothetical protein ABUS79_28240 [Pseudomonadota bacterium]